MDDFPKALKHLSQRLEEPPPVLPYHAQKTTKSNRLCGDRVRLGFCSEPPRQGMSPLGWEVRGCLVVLVATQMVHHAVMTHLRQHDKQGSHARRAALDCVLEHLSPILCALPENPQHPSPQHPSPQHLSPYEDSAGQQAAADAITLCAWLADKRDPQLAADLQVLLMFRQIRARRQCLLLPLEAMRDLTAQGDEPEAAQFPPSDTLTL